MNEFMYSVVKFIIKTGLYGFYKRIEIKGLEHVPTNKPVMFLPNHQSALMDVLLIATDCNRKPYFLTRADVFKGRFLKRIFTYFQMMPIYRIRDGRNSLSNNNKIFNACAKVLGNGNALVIFPEANHNLRRRVRPLSKGFTRIIIRSLELYPNLDIQLVPVGLNYKNATHFPDRVSVHYGKPISAKLFFDPNDYTQTSKAIKEQVTTALQKLTTHIEDDDNYESLVDRLEYEGIDFTDPIATNNWVKTYSSSGISNRSSNSSWENRGKGSFRFFLYLLNLPVYLLWKYWMKPKVPEAEFMGTFKFAFGLLAYPVYLCLLFLILVNMVSVKMAIFILAIQVVVSLCLIKYVLR
ncbi:1-acyl-sn-glycerol-3-phosphate acyltransferase [Maribacter sedimenticola]|uniref:1-acyl-sn-glycerol-3-phosphate acyltransferase n=1 Tax=Maribacter sedimenticola TaxID=228956 RepID=A0ABY1SEP3_9FLAO|nr:lysophospholipid acyltransferase family protein [Maribacter sedimenticola]SNR31954.1 1-acyl-sn-glycerol-3-phosphate acyltransferase [Maribacter sedimenticola]